MTGKGDTGGVFSRSFTEPAPIPEEGIAAAVALMRSGRLHRYGDTGDDDPGEVALFEREFAGFVGARYCVALASGGYALSAALRALEVGPGDPVLCNAFTLAPVAGAIVSVGAVPVYVGTGADLTIDLDDLAAKAGQARVLLLSHMRGHICDMDRLAAICARAGVAVIEDCAHTMGAEWNGRPSGRHGIVGCYSTQSYKHLDSGEGGLLVSDDADVAARAILLSGSYMHYGRHLAAPPAEAFAALRCEVPNVSGRMDNLRAAILRPQLRQLPERIEAWRSRYRALEEGLRDAAGLVPVARHPQGGFVGSSIQFLALDQPPEAIAALVAGCAARGVVLNWFGAPEPEGYTSRYDSWRFAPVPDLPESDRIIRATLDMRIPLAFDLADCAQVARIIREEAARAFGGAG
ncbi:DegT/DnrJ/EryC1/StrS family aminotransferase [Pontibaca methylaminivorans]|uniref:DegT/DnrJ/EryC1/StrS family aminotransferase n=1 Tax=Pontibaca methylaminivorans TaxID=515897 RepID=UPI002FD938ED